MKLLGIETSDLAASVTFADGDRLLTQALPPGMSHGAHLVPTVQAVLAEAGVSVGQLDGIGVDVGPGSYTGLRVGVSAAKTLAHFGKVPLVGLSSLELLIHNLPPTDGTASPVVVARMKSVYAACFEAVDRTWQRRGEDRVVPPAELPQLLPAGSTVFGNAVKRFADELAELGYVVNGTTSDHVSPATLIELTRRRIEARQLDDPLKLQVAYIKPPMVKLRRKAF